MALRARSRAPQDENAAVPHLAGAFFFQNPIIYVLGFRAGWFWYNEIFSAVVLA